MSSHSFTRALVAGVACTATIAAIGAFGAGAAFADPTNAVGSTAAPAQWVAVGSDTIQSLYDGFANGYVNGKGTSVAAVSGSSIASWLATGTSTIVPSNDNVSSGANAIGRPANSGDGRAALSAAWNTTNDAWTQSVNGTTTTYAVTPHSIDIARSSGKPSGQVVSAGAAGDDLTSIPLARDAVSVVINDEPTLDGVIRAGTLAAIYGAPDQPTVTGGSDFAGGVYQQSTGTDTAGDVRNEGTAAAPVEQVFDGTNWITVHPFLPYNTGSGTRQFFQTAIGSSKSATPGNQLGNGISTVVGGGDTVSPTSPAILENTGQLVEQQGDIAPFSAAQWIAQHNGIATDTVTPVSSNISIVPIGGLTPVAGTAPNLTPGTLFGDTTAAAKSGFGIFDRDVYSVAATQELNNTSNGLQTLLSQTLPTEKAITDFGFASIASVSADPTNWIHSGWENTGTAPAQPTTTSVSVSSITGTAVKLTATVSAPAGFSVPAGDTVTFYNGSTSIGTAKTNAAGVATLNYTATAGAHDFAFSADYAADAAAQPAPFAASKSASVALDTTIVPQDTLSTVKISGTARVGSKLTVAVTGQVSGSTLNYTWKTGTTTLSHASSIVIPASAYKKTITVSVYSSKADYTDSAAKTSAATATVGLGVLTAPTPKISGTTTEGKTLTAVPGSWTSGTTLKYQWKANGAAIKGATSHTFKLTSAQVGKKITVTVTGSKTDYTTVAKTSASTKAVVK